MSAQHKHLFPGGPKFTEDEIERFLNFLVEGAAMKGISESEFKATSNIYRMITQLRMERDAIATLFANKV